MKLPVNKTPRTRVAAVSQLTLVTNTTSGLAKQFSGVGKRHLWSDPRIVQCGKDLGRQTPDPGCRGTPTDHQHQQPSVLFEGASNCRERSEERNRKRSSMLTSAHRVMRSVATGRGLGRKPECTQTRMRFRPTANIARARRSRRRRTAMPSLPPGVRDGPRRFSRGYLRDRPWSAVRMRADASDGRSSNEVSQWPRAVLWSPERVARVAEEIENRDEQVIV
jgi:hypothetical protein